MTLRLCVCLFILLMITLVSRQNPVPVSNSDVSQIKYPDSQPSNCKEKGDASHGVRLKRQSGDETSEGQHYDQYIEENIEKRSNEQSDRNKRRETEEEGTIERNQFYKPVNEEAKETHPVAAFRQDIEGNSGNKIVGPRKLDSDNIRPQRQAAGDWGESIGGRPKDAAALGENFQSLEINGDAHNGENVMYPYSVQRRGRENSELEELTGTHHFSPETLETMRKINPLTIGDQVSQMIHERKCNPKNKLVSKSMCESNPGALQNEDQVADPSSVFLQDSEEAAKRQPGYEKQRLPTIVQKPCPSNDYGFSVIILAGDPLKMGGAGANGEHSGKEEKGLRNKQRGCGEGGSRDASKTNLKHLNSVDVNSNSPNTASRVQKDPNAKAEFPVYDQDLNFSPDPLNGVLEENYWVNIGNKRDDTLGRGGYQAFPRHKIQVRGAQDESGNDNNVVTTSNNGTKDITLLICGVTTTLSTTTVTDDDSDCDSGVAVEEFGDLANNITICQSWRDLDENNNNNNSTNNVTVT